MSVIPQKPYREGEPLFIIWMALLTYMACRVLASARLNSRASIGFFAYPICGSTTEHSTQPCACIQ